MLVLARPYHMDPGIGHEIEADLQAHGYPIVWLQYLPVDEDLLGWIFGEEVQAKKIRSPLDISDVWTSSNSSNTNEILWGAKFAARFPVDHLRAAPLQLRMRHGSADLHADAKNRGSRRHAVLQVWRSGFHQARGSIRIRIETIVHYLAKYSDKIISRSWLSCRPTARCSG